MSHGKSFLLEANPLQGIAGCFQLSWIMTAATITNGQEVRQGSGCRGGVLLVCCRCISPTVREGSVAIPVGALPYGRARAPLRPDQHNPGTIPQSINFPHRAFS